MRFSIAHLSTVLKYGGISFIAGAVNHGFFSESRSLWTAALGIVFYVMGAWLEMRSQLEKENAKTWRDVLGAGIVFSIGIGFFTGGLQHFPDSPERSVWVVPLGFALSVVAMSVMNHTKASSRQPIWLYGLMSIVVVTAGSLVAARMLPSGMLIHSEEAHAHSHAHSTPASAAATTAEREIVIDMLDHMRFSPNEVHVKQNETIRFVVKNLGKLRHEWVIGDEQALLAHAQEMKRAKAGSHKHDMANAISLAGGEQGVLTWTFQEAGTFAMACFEPGHYEAGMRGVIQVLPAQ